MPMTPASLSSKILTSLKGAFSPGDDAGLKAICDAIASAVISEITTNAVVTGTSISGGPVTGTIA